MKWLAPEKYRRWSASIVDQAVIFGIDPFFPAFCKTDLNACALANHLPFPASSFDLVTANMVVEHIAEPDSVLQEVFRVLKPGGAFLFHTPNLSAPPIGLSKVLPHSIKRKLVPVLEGGRQQEDVFSTYYRLNTKATIASAAGRSRYHVEWIQQVFSAPLTQMLGPFVIVELLLSRALTGECFASWRPDLICLLRKPSA